MSIVQFFGKIKQFFKRLFSNWKTRYRLSIKTEENHEEKYSFILTPQRIFVIGGTAAIALIALTAIIISVTPLKYYIPGYTTLEEHKLYLKVSAQMDSLSMLVQQNQQYLDNFYNVINDNITEDENNMAAGKSKAASHELTERKEEEMEAMREVDMQAEDLLANHLKSEEENSKLPVSHRADISNITLYTPTTGILIREFDAASNHYGIDIQNKKNTIITSVAEGIVIYTGFDPMNGNTIVIQHPGNIISIYKHNEVLLKSVGAKVNMGEAIAKMGSSGQNRMQSAHLHFELWYNGFPVNPLDYIVIK
ncbi:MAG: M23 family metallopeptidase [Bacteroidales bacterium]|nr:M23 family metallopeptidase [Bacteroidales bacterium]